MFNDITQYVLRYVSPTKFYQRRFPDWDGRAGSQIACPFHEDTNPSFSVNIGSIGGCYCHAASCRKKIGSMLHLEKEICSIQTDKEAAQKIYAEFIRPVIEFDGAFGNLLAEFRTNLIDRSPDLLKVLSNELGFDLDTVDRFSIGWDWDKKRFTFPVFNQWGDLVNVRYYKAPSMRGANTKFKIINHEGFGESSIFPLNLLETTPNPAKTLYWMKAERDTILAWSMGIPAFCTTGGEGEPPEKHIEWIKQTGCRIVICGDNDDAGRLSVESKRACLYDTNIAFASVVVPEQKDFSDWIIFENATATDFYEIEEVSGSDSPLVARSTEPMFFPPDMDDPAATPIEGEYDVASIGHNPAFLNSAIRIKGVISARLDRTYSIPQIVSVNGKMYCIPISRELLQLIGVSDKHMRVTLSEILRTNSKISYRQFITVTEVEVIPVLVPGKDSLYVNQRCYFFGEEFECNIPYNLTVIPTSSMKTQETVGMIYQAHPIANALDHIKLQPTEIDELLQKFACDTNASGEEVYLALEDLASEVSERCTQIYHRKDLHIMQLLSWVSPLQFNFHHEGEQRGWLNTLILGDTKTGKSKVATSLRDLFGCGVFLLSENCTFVGLIGGAIKTSGGGFLLRWGKIPLYNRQLVVLEELSGLSTDEISRMSDVRSSGIARLDKGGLSGETSAKTRLICLSNVRRANSNLGDYNYGAKAVQELIGQNEDISRFDLILTVTDSEVSNAVINQDRSGRPDNSYRDEEREMFRRLIKFIWSLKPEQIELTTEAYKECLAATMRMSEIYHSSIPIFKGGSDRIKLARIAVAIAAIQFSWDVQRSRLMVRECHVRAAELLMKRAYNKPSMSYGKFSKKQFQLESIADEERLKRTVRELFKTDVAQLGFFQYLSNVGTFEKEELNQSLGLSGIFTERLISTLLLSNVIRRSPNNMRIVWETTMPGRRWIEQNYMQESV